MMTISTESGRRISPSPPPPGRVSRPDEAAGPVEAAPRGPGIPIAGSSYAAFAPPAKAAARGAVPAAPSIRLAGAGSERSADLPSRALTQSERLRAMAALAASGFALGALAGLAFVLSWS